MKEDGKQLRSEVINQPRKSAASTYQYHSTNKIYLFAAKPNICRQTRIDECMKSWSQRGRGEDSNPTVILQSCVLHQFRIKVRRAFSRKTGCTSNKSLLTSFSFVLNGYFSLFVLMNNWGLLLKEKNMEECSIWSFFCVLSEICCLKIQYWKIFKLLISEGFFPFGLYFTYICSLRKKTIFMTPKIRKIIKKISNICTNSSNISCSSLRPSQLRCDAGEV